MPVHVSIHDVSPRSEVELEQALALCRARGVKPALLVVPNLHGLAPLHEAPAFVRRLRRLADEGCEILLHGLYHRSDRMGACGSATWFRQRVASAGEAEFGELDSSEASARIEAGLELLAEHGLSVQGFVPPAWIFPQRLWPVLAQHRIRYTENHFGIMNPVTRKQRASAVLNFATRSRLRLLGSVAYVRAVRLLPAVVPMRIAIDPRDLRTPLALRETVRLLDWARGDFVERVDQLFEA